MHFPLPCRRNSENQQQREKISNELSGQCTDSEEISDQSTAESKEISNQCIPIIKPEDHFQKDLQGKCGSFQQRKSTKVGLKVEAIDEKNNLQLEPKMESELSARPREGKIQTVIPIAMNTKDQCLTEQQNKNKNALNADIGSLSGNDSYKLSLALGQKKDGSPKLKGAQKDLLSREHLAQQGCSSVPSAASPAVLPAGVQYFQQDFKQDGKLWELFVDACSALAVTDHCPPFVTSELQSLQEIAKLEQILSPQPPPEDEASQDSIFSCSELEQKGKELSSSAQQESPVVSSLPNLPPPYVPVSDARGRKPVPKKGYASIAKRKLLHTQGGRNAHLQPLQPQAQVPHAVPRPPLAVSPEVKMQLVAQPLQPQLLRFPWPLQGSNGVTSASPRLPLLPRTWYGFQSYLPFSIPYHFPFSAPNLLPEEFHAKEAHGGRKGADRPPDQNTYGTPTGSGGAGQASGGGGGQGSGEGACGGGGGVSGSGAGGGGDGDPPKKPGPTRTEDRDEKKEEVEKKAKKKKKEGEEESSGKTREDSGYKSLEQSSSQSSLQASAGTLNKTEQGATVAQESSGAGLGAGAHSAGHYHNLQGATMTGHYPKFYIPDLWASCTPMSPSLKSFGQNVSPSISPQHTPPQSPPTSPLHTPPFTSPPPSPSSSLVPPYLSPHSPTSSPPPMPMSVQEAQHPMGQGAKLVLPATGQGQPLPFEVHLNEDGEESDVEPDLVSSQNESMPPQNDPTPFLAPLGEGWSSSALGLESRSSDSSSEQSGDHGQTDS